MKTKPKPKPKRRVKRDTRPALTERQRDLLYAIKEYIATHRWAPSVRDLADAMGINSPNGVMGHLHALEAKGYIVRGENRESRALYVVER